MFFGHIEELQLSAENVAGESGVPQNFQVGKIVYTNMKCGNVMKCVYKQYGNVSIYYNYMFFAGTTGETFKFLGDFVKTQEK